MIYKLIRIYIILTLCNNVNCEFYQYLKSVGSYFGYGNEEVRENVNDEMLGQVVPYELPLHDEKFISEAARLTGVALSELDTCQHRVVLKLQTSCHKMNDEQLAKMAVMLLNCQSSVEGRKIYPCTDAMSIKDCTTNMDAVSWNSYHLMSNRARAVCYSVRQAQFRGLTEHTIERLMSAARNQLVNLDKISKDQENLHEMAQQSLESVSKGQEFLVKQHSDFQRAQLHSQLALENNIQRLSEEKKLITQTNEELIKMTRSVQSKIEQAALQLRTHTDETKTNHQELIDDLIGIQNKAQIIFQRIEDSSELLLKQSEMAHQQYKATLVQLSEVNKTVHSLVSLVEGSRKALEEKLVWINSAVGGTDLALERLYAITWHVAFLFIGMIVCAFLGAQIITRLIVAISLPLNLVLTLQENQHALDPLVLSTAIGTCIIVQFLISFTMAVWQSKMFRHAIPMIKEKLTPNKHSKISTEHYNGISPSFTNTFEFTQTSNKSINEDEDDGNSSTNFASPLINERILPRSRSRTPSVLNTSIKNYCSAKTRLGTPCKLTALFGRDFCYRHQTGHSVYGD